MNTAHRLDVQVRLETTTCDHCGTFFGVPLWMDSCEFFCPRGHRNAPRSFGLSERQIRASHDSSEAAAQVDLRLNNGPVHSAQVRQLDSGCREYHGVAVIDLGELGELTVGIAIPSIGPTASLAGA